MHGKSAGEVLKGGEFQGEMSVSGGDEGEMPVGEEFEKRISLGLYFSLVVKFRRSESVKVEGRNRLP